MDSALETDHPALSKYSIQLFPNHITQQNSTTGHGTAIYGIIRTALPEERVEIIHIPLPWDEDGVSCETIITVLDELMQSGIKPDIINMSFGITASRLIPVLYEKCSWFANHGTVIVSAFDNFGAISFPAGFDNVIGVVRDDRCKSTDSIVFFNDEIINIGAKGSIQRILWSNHAFGTGSGSSFACAHVSVLVAKSMMAGKTKKSDIMEDLKSRSMMAEDIYQNPTVSCQIPFPIKKAVLFPLSKEMSALLRFQQELGFEITAVYDSKYSGRVGRKASQVLESDLFKDFIIQSIESVQWDREEDTVIVGHLDYLKALTRTDYFDAAIIQPLENHKNVYSFDNYHSAIPSDYNDHYFCPFVSSSMVPANRLDKLFRIGLPVLGVFGTSSHQGKYTVQLLLRHYLAMQGYRVAQLGTEPSALLFGMDACFPYGYNSSVEISGNETVRYLNGLMHQMEKNDPDIIIVGGQSGIVPYDLVNEQQINIPQYEFLLGTFPDAFVVCVNPFDDVDYIRRSVAFLESVTGGKTIALILYPMTTDPRWDSAYLVRKRLNSDELQITKETLENSGLPTTFILGKEDDMERLSDLVVDYFCE